MSTCGEDAATPDAKRVRLCQTGEAPVSSRHAGGDGLSLSPSAKDDPNPFPAGALQPNQQDALIIPSVSHIELPSTSMQEISFWSMSPADELPETSYHDAESFARKVLSVREVPTRADIRHLFELLPHEKPPRGDGQGRSFSCGMFAQDPLKGLRVGSRKFPFSCKVLTSFARSCAPQHVFTSLNLFLNVKTALHVDGNNDKHPNLVAGISDFRGGQILVENPQSRETCLADTKGKHTC